MLDQIPVLIHPDLHGRLTEKEINRVGAELWTASQGTRLAPGKCLLLKVGKGIKAALVSSVDTPPLYILIGPEHYVDSLTD